MIEKAMKVCHTMIFRCETFGKNCNFCLQECHVAVKPNKSSKQQALETIGKLKETLPIERAQMRMKVITPIRLGYRE